MCNCRQTEIMQQTLEILKQDNPKAYSMLDAMSPAEFMRTVAEVMANAQMIHPELVPIRIGDPEPIMLKDHPFGACEISADFNYAANWYICNQITDPKTRSECKDNAFEGYCKVLEGCAKA